MCICINILPASAQIYNIANRAFIFCHCEASLEAVAIYNLCLSFECFFDCSNYGLLHIPLCSLLAMTK
ncbi:hypothetical protein [Helicobacter rodentium]|uniref:hypothetical protein n=1 Tax=Helicobacter rodentium TaxID=59617 RepID=UPI0023F396AE|nr:hypothetical protein [Helicobacter rodentium]